MIDPLRQLQGLARKNVVPTWNEMDVREEVLAPLLGLLGYSKGTDYDINREQHLLKHPFLMVGSEKVKLDYAVLARRRHMWVLEAKRPAVQLDEKAVHQAYFYAIHPEVQARFFAVCNGLEFALYDVRTLDENCEPTLRFSVSAIDTQFADLRNIIGSDRVRDELARRALVDLEKVLLTELRKERVDELDRSIRALLTQARKATDENARALWRRRREEDDEDLKTMFPENGPVQMARVSFEFFDTPHHFGIVFGVFREKLLALPNGTRAQALDEILSILDRKITSAHRVHLIQALLRLLPALSDAEAARVREIARAEVAAILSGFSADKEKEVLWVLEGLVKRVPYKVSIVRQDFTPQLVSIVERKRAVLPEEDLVHIPPTVWGERHSWSQRRASTLFHRLASAPNDERQAAIGQLRQLEDDCRLAYEEATREGFDGEPSPPTFVLFDDPVDSYRSLLCAILLAEFEEVLPWFDDAMLASLETLLHRARKDEYSINHADVLWVRLVHARGGMETPLDPKSEAPLLPDELSLLMKRPMIHRLGWSAIESGMIIRGEIRAGQWAQYSAQLDIERRRVRIGAGKALA